MLLAWLARDRVCLGRGPAGARARPLLDPARRADRRGGRARAAARSRGRVWTGGLDYYSEYIDRARFPDPRVPGRVPRLPAVEISGAALRRRHRDAGPRAGVRRRASSRPVSGHAGRVLCHVVERRGACPIPPASWRSWTSHGRSIWRQRCSRTPAVSSSSAAPIAGSVAYEQLARRQLAGFEPRLTITYLTGLATDALTRGSRHCPNNPSSTTCSSNRDGAGQSVHPLEYLERLAAVGQRADLQLGRFRHRTTASSAAASRARPPKRTPSRGLPLRVLRGESADAIPVATADLNVGTGRLARSCDAGASARRACRRARSSCSASPACGIATGATSSARLRSCSRRPCSSLACSFSGRGDGRPRSRLRGRERALRTSYERIRDLGGRLLNAQETERARIARELHDDISQQVALLSIDLELLHGRPDRIRAAGRRGVEPRAEHREERARPVAPSASGQAAPDRPRAPRSRGFSTSCRSPASPITFTHDDVPSTLPPDVDVVPVPDRAGSAAERPQVQPRAPHVRPLDGVDAPSSALTIADDGVGFDVNAAWGRGLGLISMGERIETIEGTLAIRSTPGSGTTVEVAVPLHATEDAVPV